MGFGKGRCASLLKLPEASDSNCARYSRLKTLTSVPSFFPNISLNFKMLEGHAVGVSNIRLPSKNTCKEMSLKDTIMSSDAGEDNGEWYESRFL